METIKNRYHSKSFDELICYFMRTILHLQNTGIEKLPLNNNFEEPIKSFLELSIELIIDGQPPEISALILDAEYDVILNHNRITKETALNLQMIKKLSQHIHYDEDYYKCILDTCNLWGNEVFEYAARTFYPNLPTEIKDKYQIHELIKHIPDEMLRLSDY